MDRRNFLKSGSLLAGGAVLGGGIFQRLWSNAALIAGNGPYGPLQPVNADGLMLPAGFTSRLIAVSGQQVGATGHTWHEAPDGGACFPAPGGGWIYVSNSEVGSGGGSVGAIKFDSLGTIISAYTILSGTSRNCAGGLTPAGAWLSCEENGSSGKVFECNPQAPGQGIVRPLLGSFNHEAAFVDPVTGYVYLTEDDPNGRFYRFVPTVTGDLSAGQLFAAKNNAGILSWIPTSTTSPDRQSTTTAFNGGEGIWIDSGVLYFTTKNDVKVWKLVLATQAISVLYDGQTMATALNAVDNVTVHAPSGDLYVAEDGGNLEVCILASNNGVDEVAPFVRFVGHSASEVTGPAFSPDHTRMYLSSQRGTNGSTGRTYEVTGPFRTSSTPPTTTTTSTIAATTTVATTAPPTLAPTTTTAPTTTLAPTTTTAPTTTAAPTTTTAPTTTAPTTTTTAPTTTTTAPTTTTTAPTTTTTAPTTTTAAPSTSTTVPPTTTIARLVQRTLTITHDAHVRAGKYAATNYGNDSVLEVRTSTTANTRHAYLRVGTSPHNTPIASANLRVWVRNTGSGTNTLKLYGASNATWLESSITWNTRPALGVLLATFTVNSTTAAWRTLDVTTFVNAERAAGRTDIAFVILEPSTGSQVNVSSSEAAINRPELVLN